AGPQDVARGRVLAQPGVGAGAGDGGGADDDEVAVRGELGAAGDVAEQVGAGELAGPQRAAVGGVLAHDDVVVVDEVDGVAGDVDGLGDVDGERPPLILAAGGAGVGLRPQLLAVGG